MAVRLQRIAGADGVILQDEDLGRELTADSFDPVAREAQGAVLGEAAGRGAVFFVSDGADQWALRHYRRGGLVRHLVHDRYFWTGEESVRSFCEMRLLGEMHQRGLPVPRPVGARYVRGGLLYTADLITQRIREADPLAERVVDQSRRGSAPEAATHHAIDWPEIGRTIRSFHDAGVYHADLNAHNILLGRGPEQGNGGREAGRPQGPPANPMVWLIDFDRGSFRAGDGWKQGTLDRLARSLQKIGTGMGDQDGATTDSAGDSSGDRGGEGDPSGWPELMAGYRRD